MTQSIFAPVDGTGSMKHTAVQMDRASADVARGPYLLGLEDEALDRPLVRFAGLSDGTRCGFG